jgi:lysozyme
MATRLSADGRRLIQGFEGLSLKAYPDTTKGYSIGYGHFGAKPGDVISRDEAERLFDLDVLKYETAVALNAPITTQPQFDAMTSLAYNIGTAGFINSTVLRLHKLGDYQGAADAFRMWKKSDGKDNPVLIKRRERERAIYLNGYGNPYTGGVPPMTPAPAPSSPPPMAAGPFEAPAVPSSLAAGAGVAIALGVALVGLLLSRR